ncbi:MAG: tetratricopeptide repeat protein [Bdellovibrionota bacterium]
MSFKTINLLLYVIAIFLTNCKTAKQEKGLLDGESLEKMEVHQTDFNSIPPSLWPPAERQATATSYFLIAEMKALEGNMDAATKLFEKVYNLDPNSYVGQKLITAKIGMGKIEELLSDARKMVLLYPKSSDLRMLYGQVLANKKLYTDAIKEFKLAIRYAPTNENAYFQLISLYQGLDKPEEAEKIARELTKAVPGSLLGWSVLSRLLLVNNKSKEALTSARRAYEMQSNNPELVLIYAYILEINKRTKEAVSLYEKLFRLNPTNQELIGRLISLYRETGGLKEALNLLDEMVSTPGGDSPAVQLQRAFLLWELERYNEAATLLISLARQNPNDDRLNYLSGLGYEKIKKLDNALKMYQKIGEESPFRKHAEMRMIIVLQEQKKFQEALKISEELINQEESEWELYVIHAGIYGDLKEYKKAIETLDSGIEKFPKISRLYFLRGVNEEKSGDISACINSMKKVLELDPKNSTAYNYLGYLYAESNENLEEAEKLIRKALELKPGDGYYLDSLGWVYYRQGKYKEALSYLKQAIEKVPGEGVVLEHIGDVYQATGDTKTAIEYYKKSATSKSEERDLDRVQKKLKKLEAKLKS